MRPTPIWALIVGVVALGAGLLWGSMKLEDRVFNAMLLPAAPHAEAMGPATTLPPFRYCQSPDGQAMVGYRPDMAWLCPPGWVQVTPPTTSH